MIRPIRRYATDLRLLPLISQVQCREQFITGSNNTPSIGLAASGSGNIASFNAVNTGTTPVVATITVTPSYTNAGITYTGTPQSFTITVNPLPVTSPIFHN